MSSKNWLSKFFKKLKKILAVIFVGQLVYIILLKWVNPPITVTQVACLIEGHGLKRNYVSLSEVAPHARLAIIAAEDQLFPIHNGFDIKSIEKAMQYNQRSAGRVRGASTISQQVAKNVFLWQGRSWIRKGLEVYFTFMIELIWGKERILEMYLNVAEMGNGIFGIEAASQHYYGRSAVRISRIQSARIASCLPNPKKYVVDPPTSYITKRADWVLIQMDNLETHPDIENLLHPGKKKS